MLNVSKLPSTRIFQIPSPTPQPAAMANTTNRFGLFFQYSIHRIKPELINAAIVTRRYLGTYFMALPVMIAVNAKMVAYAVTTSPIQSTPRQLATKV